MNLVFVLFPLFLIFCGMEIMQHREELGTLKDQSVQEAAKEKIAKEHEASFKKIHLAFSEKSLKQGIHYTEVVKRYGKPSSSDAPNGKERWLYRSTEGKKMLEKPWVFLYFDEKGQLERWDCGHMECK